MTTPYRDDLDALNARHAQLVEELASVKARVGELEALQRTEQRLEGELEALRSRLDGMSARRGLPLLENIRVASPCSASWDEMAGDERVRFCRYCEKNVYNLSAMSRDEAERLVRQAAGDLCVRLYRRADGTVLTADCPVGMRRRRVRNLTAAAVGGGLLAAGAALAAPLTFVTEEPEDDADVPRVIVGAMAWHDPLPEQPGDRSPTGRSFVPPAAPHAPPAVNTPAAPEAAPAKRTRGGDEVTPGGRDGARGAKAACGCAPNDPLCTCL